jgi:hypothetical protein
VVPEIREDNGWNNGGTAGDLRAKCVCVFLRENELYGNNENVECISEYNGCFSHSKPVTKGVSTC